MKKIRLIAILGLGWGYGFSASAQSLVVGSGAATLDAVVDANEWTATPLVTLANVTLRAMADGQYLYIAD
ncbi:MAG: hypothetical protein ACI80V_001664 [Rhodothermales bacterium]|jgi:hypothetical protein